MGGNLAKKDTNVFGHFRLQDGKCGNHVNDGQHAGIGEGRTIEPCEAERSKEIYLRPSFS